MKAYNEYMDRISVSGALHRKLVSRAASTGPDRRATVSRRHATVLACLAAILLGVITVPRLLQSNVSPAPVNTPSVSQPATSVSVPGADDKYALIFNKAGSQLSADKVYIPGHFWQELTSGELQVVFPGLAETYAVTATANFRGDGTLFSIDAHTVSSSGCKAYIKVAPGEITPDYVMEGEAKTSDILGIAVTAGYYEGKDSITYFASFLLDGTGYYVELSGGKAEKAELPALLDLIIGGGAADLSIFDNPVIPELREDTLDLGEARADADFGAYLPQNLPSGFTFESALRFINQEKNYLRAAWRKGMGYIEWHVSVLGKDDKERITSVADTQNYALPLYPIPRADSVPDELRKIVDNPIFRIEDLTPEAVQARAYEVLDAGDEPGCRMCFSVLYGDILVELNVKGTTPEAVFEMLQQIKSQK